MAAVVAPSSKSLSGLIEEPRRPDDQAPSGGRAIPAGTEVEEKSIRAAETQEKRTTADKQHRQNDYLTSWPLTIVISSLALSTMLIALDTSIIGVATPTISTVFQSLNDIAWYGSAYLLTVTAFQPSFGNLYKFFDIKMTFMISLVIFESMCSLKWPGRQTSFGVCRSQNTPNPRSPSWFNRLCCCTELPAFYSRSSNCWPGRCGRLSRSSEHHYPYGGAGAKTALHGHCDQCLWDCRVHWTSHRRCSDR